MKWSISRPARLEGAGCVGRARWWMASGRCGSSLQEKVGDDDRAEAVLSGLVSLCSGTVTATSAWCGHLLLPLTAKRSRKPGTHSNRLLHPASVSLGSLAFRWKVAHSVQHMDLIKVPAGRGKTGGGVIYFTHQLGLRVGTIFQSKFSSVT